MPLWFRHGEGLPVREVAEVLSISEGEAARQIQRGMKEIRKRLAGLGIVMDDRLLAAAMVPAASQTATMRIRMSISRLTDREHES